MFDGPFTGNGNGNKLNMRIEILQGLLGSLGEGSNAKINSLRQTMQRNKTDMADDACKSLDLMRQVFQAEMTDELQQIIERHIRTTFSPALENLKRNGHEATEEDIRHLCRSILEAAKKPFLSSPSQSAGFRPDKDLDSASLRGAESDLESETSIANYSACQRDQLSAAPRGRRRGRPPKNDPYRSGTPLVHMNDKVAIPESAKWNPDRLCSSSRFILASKVSRMLMLRNHRKIFLKYPFAFRYCCDEADRNWMIGSRLTTRLSGTIYIMLLEDAGEVAVAEKMSSAACDFERFSFCVPASMILKMKQEMRKVYERSKIMAVS